MNTDSYKILTGTTSSSKAACTEGFDFWTNVADSKISEVCVPSQMTPLQIRNFAFEGAGFFAKQSLLPMRALQAERSSLEDAMYSAFLLCFLRINLNSER